MEQNISLDDPARAFDELRREVSFGLRAIQGLTAERRDQPDYSGSLKTLDDQLATVSKTLSTIAISPAMRLTPGSLTNEIVKASTQARAADAETLRAAGARSKELVHQLRLGIEQVQAAKQQRTRVRWATAAGIGFGILIWSILPGAFLRSLPAPWHGPEWMATRVMRMDRVSAARRLWQGGQVSVPPGKAGSAHRGQTSVRSKPPTGDRSPVQSIRRKHRTPRR